MESKHQIEIIFATPRGRTYQCKTCDFIQIEFGNFNFASDKNIFYCLKNVLDTIDLNDVKIYHGHMHKKIVLEPFPNAGFYCFCKEEILELRELVDGTLAMLEIEDFLDQNYLRSEDFNK